MLIEARKVAKKGNLLGGHNIKITIGKEVIVENIEPVGKNEYCVWYKDEIAINSKTTLEIARRYALCMLIDEIWGLSADKENWFFRIEKPTHYDSYSTFRLSRGDRRMVVSMWYHGNHADVTVLSYTDEHKKFDGREFMQDVANYVKHLS